MAILHPKHIHNSRLSNCRFETTNSNPANYNYINKVSQSNTLSTLQSNQTSETGLSFPYDLSLSRNSERATNFYDIKSDNSSNHSEYATYLSTPVPAINQPVESRSENKNEYFDRELNTDINVDDNMAILHPKHICNSVLSNCHFETTNSNLANYKCINKVSQSNTSSTLQSNQTSETGLSFSYDSSLSRNSERATNFYDITSDNSSNHSEYATYLSTPVPAINEPIESRSENKNEYFDRELNTDINVDDNMAILHPKHIYNSTLSNCHFETTNSNPANYNYINKVSQSNTSSTWQSNQTFDTGQSFSYDSSLSRSSETATNFYDIKSDNRSNHSEYIRHFNSPFVNQPQRENEHKCFDHRFNTDIYNNWIRETMNQTNQDSKILPAMSSILKATQDYHIASKLDSNYSNLQSLSKKTTNSYEAMSEGDFAHDLTGPMEVPRPVQTISPHKPIGSKIGDNTYHFLGETSKMDIDSTLPCLDSYTNTKHPYTCSLCQKGFNKTSHLKVHWRKHSGERPYHCIWQNCNKNFTRSDELKRHERTHTGERNHSCSKCEKKFTRSDHLKKHIKTHRQQEMEEMEVDMNEGYDVTKNPFMHF